MNDDLSRPNAGRQQRHVQAVPLSGGAVPCRARKGLSKDDLRPRNPATLIVHRRIDFLLVVVELEQLYLQSIFSEVAVAFTAPSLHF
jgi:hypothetical protein